MTTSRRNAKRQATPMTASKREAVLRAGRKTARDAMRGRRGSRTLRRQHAEHEDGCVVLVTMARSMRTAARHAASGMPWETSEQRDNEAAWRIASRAIRPRHEYRQLAKFPESMQRDERGSKLATSNEHMRRMPRISSNGVTATFTDRCNPDY